VHLPSPGRTLAVEITPSARWRFWRQPERIDLDA